ncbi:hypothetical protein niasHT_001795 [Heterodera trifolii]|uniref:Uncharacterized protein n=1 Tax=Heterodera trifolii TaxID=157864 RepID=A0ABD2MCX1_9BILA
MAKLKRNIKREAVKQRWQKQEERKAQTKSARQAYLAKRNAPQPNPNAETPQQDKAGPTTSAAPIEEAMERPPSTPATVPTPEMDDELLDFGDLVPSTSATPIGDLVPFPSTPIAPMDTGEMTPPPLVIDDRSERIEQPKAHLLLNHFVPFARQHSFLGLLDEQGDEALHSVWRRLEQWWKCMPDADQILQQLEHHFVSNWLLDTGRIAEMKQRLEDQKDDDNFLENSDGENDEGSVIDVVG